MGRLCVLITSRARERVRLCAAAAAGSLYGSSVPWLIKARAAAARGWAELDGHTLRGAESKIKYSLFTIFCNGVSYYNIGTIYLE